MILFLKPVLWGCSRLQRPPVSCGPTLLGPSLKVQRDRIHNPPPGYDFPALGLHQRASHLGVPSQEISVARGASIARYSTWLSRSNSSFRTLIRRPRGPLPEFEARSGFGRTAARTVGLDSRISKCSYFSKGIDHPFRQISSYVLI